MEWGGRNEMGRPGSKKKKKNAKKGVLCCRKTGFPKFARIWGNRFFGNARWCFSAKSEVDYSPLAVKRKLCHHFIDFFFNFAKSGVIFVLD